MSNLQQDCPSCGRQLELPATAVGRQARCPACETVFVVGGNSSFGDPPPSDLQSPAAQNPFTRPDAGPAARPGQPAAFGGGGNPYAETVGPAAGPAAPQDAANPYSPNTADVPDPSLPFQIRQVGIDPIFSPSFELFKNRIGEMLAIGGISFGVSFVLQIAQQVAAPVADALDPILGGILLMVTGFGSGFAGVYVTTGAIAASLAVLRNQPSPISRFFVSPMPMLKLIAGYLILALLAIPIAAICAIPAFAVGGEEGILVSVIAGSLAGFIAMTLGAIFLWAWPILVVDGHPGVIAPMRTALKISMANKGTSFLIMIIGILCGLLGFFMCCIGAIATYPFKILMCCAAYSLMTGKINQVAPQQGAPSMY